MANQLKAWRVLDCKDANECSLKLNLLPAPRVPELVFQNPPSFLWKSFYKNIANTLHGIMRRFFETRRKKYFRKEFCMRGGIVWQVH
jgi:hypothetical protein